MHIAPAVDITCAASLTNESPENPAARLAGRPAGAVDVRKTDAHKVERRNSKLVSDPRIGVGVQYAGRMF